MWCTVHEKAGESREDSRTNDDGVSFAAKQVIFRTMMEIVWENYNGSAVLI